MQLRSTRRGRQEATRVLIADDDSITRRLLQKTLEKAGYEVVAVENGHKALEFLSSKLARGWRFWIGSCQGSTGLRSAERYAGIPSIPTST